MVDGTEKLSYLADALRLASCWKSDAVAAAHVLCGQVLENPVEYDANRSTSIVISGITFALLC